MSKTTVYPIPGTGIANVPHEKQSVEAIYAEELVSSGAFSYTDLTDEQKDGLQAQEDKRQLDAQQSDPDINWAKMEDKQAAANAGKLPPEAVTKVTPDPANATTPRSIYGGSAGMTLNGGGDGQPTDEQKAGVTAPKVDAAKAEAAQERADDAKGK